MPLLTELDSGLQSELAPELEVLRLLGKGSTATVYLAQESALKRPVAVKVMRPEFLANENARRRFEREAQAAASLSHPHVTHVYRVGRLRDTRPYIVMEFIDGRSLADMIRARGALPMAEARSIMSSLASALAMAHAHGIVHRDVHPGNVFIETRTGRAVLSDFGIAGLLDAGSGTTTRVTKVGDQFGYVHYSSPENVRGEPLTEQSDVYSLGVLGYELVTGRRPFEHANLAQMIKAHLQDAPPDARTFRPDIDTLFQRVLEKCLAKEPNLRPRASDIPGLLERGTGPTAVTNTGGTGFFEELKRRRMYQAIITYVVVAFGVVQGADLLGGAYDMPNLGKQSIAVTLAGFPVALVLSWIYDVRQGRIQRTEDVTRRASTLQRLLPWVGLTLSVATAAFLWWVLNRP